MKILIVDDHPIYAEGLKNLLATWHYSEIFIANSGPSAIAAAVEKVPDIVLMDIGMPGMDGIAATAAIKARLPSVKIVMLTSLGEEELLFRAIKAGASGYLLKTTEGETLVRCLSELNEGRNPFSAGLEEAILTEFKRSYDEGDNRKDSPEQNLSDRQRDVLRLLSRRLGYKEIGRELFISERTVKFHIERIKDVLGLQTKEELVDFALRKGMGV
jgi:two-component system NarL family response regulator